ncbi:O-antigen ligase family protein [sulfur-oxidizing endosymbiont of Gigantopelta aegis]|uniref:O-antigen ligase family protein n=1 Tax=sulfur-oxidizing endosymbiont of Gigantopelta aegis TaxID=2794934 RepID=UPI0018DD6565|nr:O-antigen ligase family protein [sulfur-oxidizing endosymbiont of Gigantopelta aegis]
MKTSEYINNTNTIISRYILLLGFFFFLTGILFFKSISAYHTQIYLFLILPSLVLLTTQYKTFIPILSSKSFKTLLILMSYALISVFWNDPSIEDLKYFKRMLIVLLFIFSLIVINKENSQRLLQLLLVAAILYSLAAYYSIYSEYLSQSKTIEIRIIGMGNLSNPLLSSHIYGVFSVFIMTYYFSKDLKLIENIGLVLIFVGLISFIILTLSRTPLVGLSAALVLLLWMHRSKKTLYFLFIIGCLASIYAFFNFEQLTSRGLSFRPEIWSIAFDKISHKPFFGYGIGTNINIYIDGLKTLFSDTHNIHIGLTYNLGLIGLVIWVSLLISLFFIYLKNKSSIYAQLGTAILVYGMSAGMTEGMSFFSRPKEVWFLTWLPIALLFVAEYQRLTSQSQQPHKDL